MEVRLDAHATNAILPSFFFSFKDLSMKQTNNSCWLSWGFQDTMDHLGSWENHFLKSILVQYNHRTEHDHPQGRAKKLLSSWSTFLIPFLVFVIIILFYYDLIINWTKISLYATNWYDLTQVLIRNYFQKLPFWEIKFGVWCVHIRKWRV